MDKNIYLGIWMKLTVFEYGTNIYLGIWMKPTVWVFTVLLKYMHVQNSCIELKLSFFNIFR